MRIIRFNRPFRYSDIESYNHCPMKFYLQNSLNLKKKFISWQSVMGKAIKLSLWCIHQEEKYYSYPEKLECLLISKYEELCQSFLEAGIEIREAIPAPFTSYIEMLEGYIKKRENSEAKIIYSKANFRFAIKPFTTTYNFTGSIDQLRQNNDGTTELVIFKSGRKSGHRAFELFMNYQLSICAYALFRGEISTDEGSLTWHKPGIIPDYVSLYFLQDHLTYRRAYKKRDGAGSLITCSAGEEKGPVLYRSTRNPERLSYIPQELGRICAAIRRNDFFPRPNILCQKYCNYRDYCQAAITFSLR